MSLGEVDEPGGPRWAQMGLGEVDEPGGPRWAK